MTKTLEELSNELALARVLSDEFPRQLRFAHDRGLLSEALQRAQLSHVYRAAPGTESGLGQPPDLPEAPQISGPSS